MYFRETFEFFGLAISIPCVMADGGTNGLWAGKDVADGFCNLILHPLGTTALSS